MVPVLNMSVCVRLHGAEPNSVQRFSELMLGYMTDPASLEAEEPRR
jgi:hypothetical protein